MFPLCCTVRGCGRDLAENGTALCCAAGHAFDRAREGYFNLLQPQDRRSSAAGDRDAALEARARWIERGLADGLILALGRELHRIALEPGALVADLGCGDGALTARLLAERRVHACGVDLAVRAVRGAARRAPSITWAVANADRGLPFPDGSIDVLLSIYGRRPVAEMRRVLRAGGHLVAVLPAEDDLIELRDIVQGRGDARDRSGSLLEELAPSFTLEGRTAWRERARLARPGIEDALALTYRGARRRERERLGSLETLEVTLAAEILRFRPTSGRGA
jgi:23S rRNA (guanine745-N1)-methyltransferase